jgi:CDP-diacylglycerol--inositol 3-phosphatidyltransferase
VLFLFLAVAVYETHPLVFVFSYVISAVLDAFDGMAARRLGQSTCHVASTIGMVLDMSIDRLSYMMIQNINFILWPRYSYVYAVLIFLDGISHLAIVSGSLVSGNTTHKLKDEETHWLLRLYYGTHLLFTLCFCSEVGLM